MQIRSLFALAVLLLVAVVSHAKGKSVKRCKSKYQNCHPVGTVVLTRSLRNSQIIWPGAQRNATASPYPYGNTLSDLNAVHVWDNDAGVGSQCNMTITLRDSFIQKCPGQPITMQVSADNIFNLTVLGQTRASTAGPFSKSVYTFSTAGIGCSNDFSKVDVPIVMDITATNIPLAGRVKCQNNPAAVIWSITSPDVCSCTVGGSYYNWKICGCSTCASAIVGCLSCTSNATSVVCQSCSTAQNYVLNSVTGICDCKPGTSIPVGCLTCTPTKGNCQLCDIANNFVQQSGKCVCKSGYTLIQASCKACPTLLSNCVTCTSASVCTSCTNRLYALSAGSCKLCSAIMSNCVNCSSESSCLSCINNTFALSSSRCVACSALLVGCIQCATPTVCTSCNATAHLVLFMGQCVCATGYAMVANVCTTCSSLFVGCAQCTSSTCTLCSPTFVLDGSDGCRCQLGSALHGTSCISCGSFTSGCINCLTNSSCTGCNTTLHLILQASSCVCEQGYIQIAAGCVACSSILTNCTACTNTTACTACSSGYLLPGGICGPCSLIHPHCLTCTAGPICQSCDTTNNFVWNGANNCTCNVPAAVSDGNGGCVPCSNIAGCSECSSILSCDVCQPSYLPDGLGGCQTCSVMTNCLTCSSLTSCAGCFSGYALDNGGCTNLCSSTMPGCVECSSPLVCTSCDPTLFLTMDTTTSQCVCSVGYYNSSGTCLSCSLTIVGCTACADQNTCTTCDPHLFMQVNSTNGCSCIVGKVFSSVAGQCQQCSDIIPNCQNCNDQSTCTSCSVGFGLQLATSPIIGCAPCSSLMLGCNVCSDSSHCSQCSAGYALNTSSCQLCSTTLSNCVQCSSLTTCTQCLNNSFAIGADGTCRICSWFMPGCLECSGNSACLFCDPAGNFIPGGTGCVCQQPYVLNTTSGLCILCQIAQSTCLACITSTTCTTCVDGYYVDSFNSCSRCPIGCVTCSASSNCMNCEPSLHYVLVGSQCVCSIGYVADSNSVCRSVCGDGHCIQSTEQCDDGNTINGDGCSSTCTPQADWLCVNAQEADKTLCSYTKSYSMNVTTISKPPDQNTIVIVLSIHPTTEALLSLNFSSLIHTSLDLYNATFTVLPDGNISVSYQYNTTLEGSELRMTIDPAAEDGSFFATPRTSIFLNLSTTNDNMPITYYNSTVYLQQQQFDTAYKGGVGIAYALLGVGLFVNKVIGIELLAVWQTAFLSLSNIDKVQPLLSPLMQLKFVNGYNIAGNHSNSTVPSRVEAIGYQAQFLNNVNVMLWVILADVVLGGCLYLLALVFQQYKQSLQLFANRLLNEYLLMLVLLNTSNFAYSAGLQFAYSQTMYSLDGCFAILGLALPVTLIVTSIFAPSVNFAELKLQLRSNKTAQAYSCYTLVYKIVLGLMMSQLNEIEEATIATFSVAVVYLVYVLASVPFKSGMMNYRSVVAQLSAVSVLGVTMYYRSMKSTTDPAAVSLLLEPAYFEIVVVYLASGISTLSLINEVYLKIKKPVERVANDYKDGNTQHKLDEVEHNDTHENLKVGHHEEGRLSRRQLQSRESSHAGSRRSNRPSYEGAKHPKRNSSREHITKQNSPKIPESATKQSPKSINKSKRPSSPKCPTSPKKHPSQERSSQKRLQSPKRPGSPKNPHQNSPRQESPRQSRQAERPKSQKRTSSRRH